MSSEEARAPRYSDLFAEKHEHTPDCAYCPICATIAVVRKTKPEVLEHLAVAARELISAAALLLEEAGEVIGSEAAKRNPDDGDDDPGKVRRINIS
jgi:hypothetical protein